MKSGLQTNNDLNLSLVSCAAINVASQVHLLPNLVSLREVCQTHRGVATQFKHLEEFAAFIGENWQNVRLNCSNIILNDCSSVAST